MVLQNVCFDFLYKFVWNISHSKKNSVRCYHKHTYVFTLITPYSSRVLIKRVFSLQIFEKIPKYPISWKFVLLEPKCPTAVQQLSNSSSTAVQQLSNSCPTAIQQLFNSCPTAIQQLFKSSPTVVQQLSNSCPTAVQQLSNSCPPVVQQLSNSCPTAIQQLFNSCPTVVQQLSNSYPTVVQQLSNSCPTVVQQLSNAHWQTCEHSDVTKVGVALRNFAKAPKSDWM
jgi:hypothetical protein